MTNISNIFIVWDSPNFLENFLKDSGFHVTVVHPGLISAPHLKKPDLVLIPPGFGNHEYSKLSNIITKKANFLKKFANEGGILFFFSPLLNNYDFSTFGIDVVYFKEDIKNSFDPKFVCTSEGVFLDNDYKIDGKNLNSCNKTDGKNLDSCNKTNEKNLDSGEKMNGKNLNSGEKMNEKKLDSREKMNEKKPFFMYCDGYFLEKEKSESEKSERVLNKIITKDDDSKKLLFFNKKVGEGYIFCASFHEMPEPGLFKSIIERREFL